MVTIPVKGYHYIVNMYKVVLFSKIYHQIYYLQRLPGDLYIFTGSM